MTWRGAVTAMPCSQSPPRASSGSVILERFRSVQAPGRDYSRIALNPLGVGTREAESGGLLAS